jgi:succinyl-CoA synthetase beta subunit
MKLSSEESRKLFVKYGVPVVDEFFVKNKRQLETVAKRLVFPLVVKIESPDIIHKTEARCVFTDIRDREELMESFDKLYKNAKKHNPKARIDGVIVQEHCDGYEFIIGGKIDEQFGPIILFGAGGIFTEVFKDTSIRICPVERKDLEEMIAEVKFSRVFDGFRGKPPIDKRKIINILMKINKLMLKEKIKELDINPLMVSEKKIRAVDIRIIK